eukprot:COSAG06_NODE_2364_length_7003_cov_3.258980_2_plen_34_part_00
MQKNAFAYTLGVAMTRMRPVRESHCARCATDQP